MLHPVLQAGHVEIVKDLKVLTKYVRIHPPLMDISAHISRDVIIHYVCAMLV